jgi:hypothetical protein
MLNRGGRWRKTKCSLSSFPFLTKLNSLKFILQFEPTATNSDNKPPLTIMFTQCALLLAAFITPSNGFASRSSMPFSQTHAKKENLALHSAFLPMMETSAAFSMDDSPLLSILTPFLLSAVSSDSIEMLRDPKVEAEVLTGFSHVALDFAGFIPGAKSFLRVITVIGRIFSISADYLQHHSLYSQNLDINCLLIAVALAEMIQKNHTQEDEHQGNQPPKAY